MKTFTMQKRVFTAEYWDYTTTIDPINGQVNTFYKVADIKVSVIPAEKGLLYMYHPTQFRRDAQIRNLRDADGNLVFQELDNSNTTIAYVGTSEPYYDIYGTLAGFRHDISQGF